MRHPVRLFENPVLERLTKAHPQTVAFLWGPVIGALWGWAMAVPEFRWSSGLGWAVLGVLCWTLFEYGLHRFAFHWRARTDWGRRLVFLMHGCHHADPEDPLRAVMPPMASVPLAAALYALAVAALPEPVCQTFFAGFLMGYLHYDLTHWACHQARLKGNAARWLRRHHLRHHYAGKAGNYGVGSPLWDVLFGSMLERRVKS